MQDKTVFITGGTGSFGQAMTKELLTKGVKQIRIFSRDELKQATMQAKFNDPRLCFICGDVRDQDQLSRAMEGCDVVIHSAAMKRIEKCETNPHEAIKTNVLGTQNVAKACLDNNVQSAIFISTDKAAYAINLYGATKLAAEKIWIQSNVYRGTNHPTKFSVVRYGNVVGSRGSVMHIFKDQVTRGFIKVTDQRMTRFFITLQEAVDLVQLAIELQQGGELFIPRLKAISIYHLATLIAGDIPVEITSQRGGEKLHESLITKEEKDRMASFQSFSVVNPEITTWPYTPWTSEYKDYCESSEHAEQFSDAEIRKLLQAASLQNS